MNTLIETHNRSSFVHELTLDIKMALREPSFIWPTLAFPLMFYVFFGIVFSDHGGQNSSTYLMVSYGVFGIMAPALFGFGASVASERDKGWLAIKQISPVSAWQYMAAKLVNAIVFSLVIVIGLFTLGAVFGDVVLARSQWLAIAGLMLIGSLPFCAIGLAIGFWVKGKAATAVLNLIFLPSAFLSGLAIPVIIFPTWLQKMAMALPPYHLSQLGLSLVDMSLGQSIWLHIGCLIITLIVASFIAVKGYHHCQTK
ncbi:ABC transporter permease [Psychrobium sp. MM17-31]|uniref:ABC transporter permease n=1 Tax=Psychrobium sp. MM17-31 TaxID=2917758 RepID=UPI001EF6EFB1|nr:ABC transporter permease [Psychrobium sp. MM17-31]MCG7532008.1 ABC transporter permease [Psychrobium sp. MM17-31]